MDSDAFYHDGRKLRVLEMFTCLPTVHLAFHQYGICLAEFYEQELQGLAQVYNKASQMLCVGRSCALHSQFVGWHVARITND